jgi:aspartate kinase
MIVHKFGGASIKDAEGIKNVAKIISAMQEVPSLIVVSALGKTTNKLESVVREHWKRSGKATELLSAIRTEHEGLIGQLWPQGGGPLDEVNDLFVELEWALEDEPRDDFNYEYDQIVSFGELLSTTILSSYLNEIGFRHAWVDARDLIKTDNNFRDARVDFDLTAEAVKRMLNGEGPFLTQGFIGCTSENFNSTLGREGSDYSAAILAYLLGAEEVWVWKDVPGLMSGDPQLFDNAVLIDQLSYAEAIELAYFGAKVIHPRTIQPLKAAQIPLRIKSFFNPRSAGTLVGEDLEQEPKCPFFIKRADQVLISIRDKMLDFIAEDHLSEIFAALSRHRFRVRLMQNSAVSFSVVGDHQAVNLDNLIEELSKDFNIRFNTDLDLFTVRNYSEQSIAEIVEERELLLEQRSRSTVQLLVK